jgi:hypothetical protein
MDEMWAIDLNKLDGVKEIYRRELQDWQAAGDEDSENDEDEDDDDDEGSDEDDGSEVASTIASTVPTVVSTAATSVQGVDDEATVEEVSAISDGLPYPRPFESLREFYDRTRVQWQEVIVESLNRFGHITNLTVKEISTKGFERAEEKWWDCREEIRLLEDEQTEAGIENVISLADKEGTAGGVGRRR